MNWISVKEALPETNTRVLVFSPVYGPFHDMCFRIMGGEFVRICTEATHWTYLERPDEIS